MEVNLGKNKENYKYEVYLQDLTLIDSFYKLLPSSMSYEHL